MTMLPPGLIAPSDPARTVVAVERPPSHHAPAAPRWSAWSVVFVLLLAFTVLAVVVAIVDVLNG